MLLTKYPGICRQHQDLKTSKNKNLIKMLKVLIYLQANLGKKITHQNQNQNIKMFGNPRLAISYPRDSIKLSLLQSYRKLFNTLKLNPQTKKILQSKNSYLIDFIKKVFKKVNKNKICK